MRVNVVVPGQDDHISSHGLHRFCYFLDSFVRVLM